MQTFTLYSLPTDLQFCRTTRILLSRVRLTNLRREEEEIHPRPKIKVRLDTLGIVLCFVTSVFQFKSSPTSPLFETPMISINYVN